MKYFQQKCITKRNNGFFLSKCHEVTQLFHFTLETIFIVFIVANLASDSIFLEKKKNNSSTRNIANVHTFMILHWATPVTVSGTPCAVSTPSHIGFKVMTSSDRRWTSVTNHHAHAHPPTIVRFLVDPQHPPVKRDNNMNQWRSISIFKTYVIR